MLPHHLLAHLLHQRPLSEADALDAVDDILSARLDPPQIAALLALIQVRGPTVDELVGAARAMRRHLTPIPFHNPSLTLLDTCGTGGAPKTFNVSTAAAIVAAAASPSLAVAKHGNRSRTGRGSAEVLATLGVNIDAPPHIQALCLQRARLCFCFAIHHHPAARHAAPVRRALGFPTLFNLLGPLSNPANASHQLLGVYSLHAAQLVAHALARLGCTRAIVLHSDDGLDELSLNAPTSLFHVRNGSVSRESLNPATLGLQPAPLDALTARDLPHAAQLIRDVLADTPGPAHDLVALNAAAALLAADAAPDLRAGLLLARSALRSGAAAHTLATLATTSHSPATP
ncbi:MAG: anthranilate phosphoribosyltransferase [Phycisphaerae bacterium]|nr:anthranilate phosphoribosyltransferase [Phycisphaerae bacterium]